MPSKCPWFCRRTDFAFKGPLPSISLCRRRAFGIEGHFLLSHRSTYKASIYSIALNAATSSYLHSLVMQHPPIQPYQGSIVCEERGCLLLQSYNSHFAFGQPLPSNCFCFQSAFAFAIEGPLPSKGFSIQSSLGHRRAFAIERPSQSWGLCLQSALATSTCLCHRRPFSIVGPLPSKCRPLAFAIDGPLPSRGFGLQRLLAFAIERPLLSKGLCLQSALGFAAERTLPSNQRAFAVEGPLVSEGLCRRRAFAFVFEGHFLLSHRSTLIKLQSTPSL